jgi:glycine cleavage system aminomethyltransferase T
LSPDESPWEAGLTYTVKLDKPMSFLGREALIGAREAGITKRLIQFTFDDPNAFPWGGEPLLMDGQPVGELTSAGYSRKYGRAVAMGYARTEAPMTDETLLTARYEVDIAGERFAVTPHLKLP